MFEVPAGTRPRCFQSPNPLICVILLVVVSPGGYNPGIMTGRKLVAVGAADVILSDDWMA